MHPRYPKIQTLYKRNHTGKGKGIGTIILDQFSCPEFENIKNWLVTEKIDGTNIRVIYTKTTEPNIEIKGRNENSQIPANLVSHLKEKFQIDKLSELFWIFGPSATATNTITFYGEGYGPKIQKGGGLYRKDQGFILFDIKIGNWWLKREKIKEFGEFLNIPTVPIIGIMTIEEIVEFVKKAPNSQCSIQPKQIEGIVARTEPLTLFRHGNPIMFKLKVRDFKTSNVLKTLNRQKD